MSREEHFARRKIAIRDEKHGLPYSKGLMASSIMATGLAPSRAYYVAKLIEDTLREDKKFAVTIEDLRQHAAKILREHVGGEYALKYLRWQALGQIDRPLIVMIGGTTGVGKSTIASEVAHRLGITRIVSTDSLREVMRAVFSEEMMPALYESSFNAWKKIRVPVAPDADPVPIGFKLQTATVAVGIRAVIARAVRESLNMVIEGVHVVPGYVESKMDKDAFIVPMVIDVEEEELHRSHFYVRELETDGFRPYEKYRANFANIRKVGDFIRQIAGERDIPVIYSHDLDATVSQVMEVIMDRVLVPETIEAAAAAEGKKDKLSIFK